MRKRWIVAAALAGSLSLSAAEGAAAQATPQVHRTAISHGADGALEVDNGAAAQVDDELFKGTEKFAAKAKSVNEVNMDKNMLSAVAKGAGKKAELAKKVNFIVIRNYEYAQEGDYDAADVDVFFRKLDGAGWKHVVRTRDGKDRTDICIRQDGNGMTETVIISAEPKELNFIHMSGTGSLADLQKMGGLADK